MDMGVCTMMKPHLKGKTTSTKPMYSRKLICPSCIEKHSTCGRENTPQCPLCGIIVCRSAVLWISKVMGIPRAKPEEFDYTPHSGYNTHTP